MRRASLTAGPHRSRQEQGAPPAPRRDHRPAARTRRRSPGRADRRRASVAAVRAPGAMPLCCAAGLLSSLARVSGKSERRAARSVVADYHRAQLGGLVARVGEAVDRYRAGDLDAFDIDQVLPVLAGGEGAVEVLQPPAGGGCSGADPGPATIRLVETRSSKKAVVTRGSLAADAYSSAAVGGDYYGQAGCRPARHPDPSLARPEPHRKYTSSRAAHGARDSAVSGVGWPAVGGAASWRMCGWRLEARRGSTMRCRDR